MAHKTFARFVGLLALLDVILLLVNLYVLDYISKKWRLIASIIGLVSLGMARWWDSRDAHKNNGWCDF